MKHLDIVLDVNGDNLQLQFHPDSLVMMVSDLKQEGLSDEEIAVEIENLRASILEDYKQKLEDGTLDENDFEDEGTVGCGNPNCTNCGTDVVYH